MSDEKMHNGAANWLMQFAKDCENGLRLTRHSGDDAMGLFGAAKRIKELEARVDELETEREGKANG